jgi:hypothetical protein
MQPEVAARPWVRNSLIACLTNPLISTQTRFQRLLCCYRLSDSVDMMHVTL